MKPFDQDSWQEAHTPDDTKAFTRYVPQLGVLILYERHADNHWFLAVHRNRTRIGCHELGKQTESTAKAAALQAVGLREPNYPHKPLDDDFFAFVPGTCSRCRQQTDILKFKSQCQPCLLAPVKRVA